jgi:hypothetical protein
MYCIISVVYDYITIFNTILTLYNTQLVDLILQLFIILNFFNVLKKYTNTSSNFFYSLDYWIFWINLVLKYTVNSI